MNIFYLNRNPRIAAQEHLDKHVVKMILESAQLLCTAHRLLDGKLQLVNKLSRSGKPRTAKRYVLSDPHMESVMYNATHMNHPCAIWSRDNINNYMWLYELFVALCDEYTFRYGKKHKSDLLLRDVLKNAPVSISTHGFTEPAQAMPDKYRHADAVVAYQQYYINEKAKFAKWTKRPQPSWFKRQEYNHGDINANI